MLLKRKRSESEFSCSSASTLSSPPRPDGFFHASPAHLHSRTLKRYRDNRPSEDEVHQHTLSLLYSAQQPQVRPLRLQHNNEPSQDTSVLAPSSTTQSSLHSFWRLPTSGGARPRPPSSTVNLMDQTGAAGPSTSCGECGQDLVTAGMSTCEDMEIDGVSSLVDHAASAGGCCLDCAKAICHDCSISNLDEQRRCLTCLETQRKDARKASHSRSLFTRV
ncbi:hypothetical protein Micbo1qcDRAFT_198377 [Microdochium bolleyi]|uniref:Uncharacterized protein n=1 Tax=Microdochium bolleyi TaxID=196109 RepID=A0A136IMT1_9PEZI|nr:hypothetical protein Micbo1qcDRAFT_198377 [Microdochium bolleyi]